MIEKPVVNAKYPQEKLLMGPGPSNVHPKTSEALSRPILGHLDPDFLQVMDDVQSMLRYTFQTNNRLTLPLSATGSAGMETCIVNLIEPGDRMVVAINGVFGQRMKDVASRAGADVHVIDRNWGGVFDLEEIEKALKDHSPKVFAIVHAETSTGAQQPMEGLGDLVHKYGALLLVDCVTSLGGSKLLIDEWGIDAAYSGTQKCLSCPPGLSPVTFSSRAEEVIENRKSKVQSWYLDMSMVRSYFGGERAYHHTAPINMNYALHESLLNVVEEGLENRWKRHEKNHEVLKAGLEALGLEFVVDKKYRLPQLNSVKIPGNLNDVDIRKRLLNTHKIELGGGLGGFKGKVWRIGLMGQTCQVENIFRLLGALEESLAWAGYKTNGESISAAQKVFAGQN